MYSEDRSMTSRLSSLVRRKKSVEQQIERAYLRDNVVHYLHLESQHNNILTKIDKLTPKL
jgi:hypothetical protein